MGEVLLVISGEILSNALSSALSTSSTDSSKLSSWQQATWAEERPPGIARGNPTAKEQNQSCPFPETQPKKSVTGFAGIPSLAACWETAQSLHLKRALASSSTADCHTVPDGFSIYRHSCYTQLCSWECSF